MSRTRTWRKMVCDTSGFFERMSGLNNFMIFDKKTDKKKISRTQAKWHENSSVEIRRPNNFLRGSQWNFEHGPIFGARNAWRRRHRVQPSWNWRSFRFSKYHRYNFIQYNSYGGSHRYDQQKYWIIGISSLGQNKLIVN